MTDAEKQQVRNETIDELTNWLQSCIETLDHKDPVYLGCTAMVKAMIGKKTPEPQEEHHIPLSRKA